MPSDVTRRRDRPRAGRGCSAAATSTTEADRARRTSRLTADVVVREPGVICGLERAHRGACGCSTRDAEMELLAAEGDAVAARTRRRSPGSMRRRPRAPDRRAHRPQPRAADVGHRDRHPGLRRGGARHRASRSSTRERPRPACGALDKRAVACGGGTKPPDRPRRRDPDQGQPRRDCGRRSAPAIAARRGRQSGSARSRSRSTPRPARRSARRRRRGDPARQHASRRSCAGPSPAPRAAPGSRPQAASRSTPSAPSPRPASTRSRSGHSPTR